jgi:hypothetical protein
MREMYWLLLSRNIRRGRLNQIGGAFGVRFQAILLANSTKLFPAPERVVLSWRFRRLCFAPAPANIPRASGALGVCQWDVIFLAWLMA